MATRIAQIVPGAVAPPADTGASSAAKLNAAIDRANREQWLPEITSRVGGTASDLDSLETVVPANYLVNDLVKTNLDNEGIQYWRLLVNATPVSDFFVQPLDNPLLRWVRIS